MRKLLVLTLFLVLSVPAVQGWSWAKTAEESEKEPALDYQNMLNSVFKGIKDDPETGDLVTAAEKVLRRPGTKERTVLPEGSRLNEIEVIQVRGDGRRYIVLFCNVQTEGTEVSGGGAAILAVFPEGAFEAQDVADVKSDVFCGISSHKLLPLGTG